MAYDGRTDRYYVYEEERMYAFGGLKSFDIGLAKALFGQ